MVWSGPISRMRSTPWRITSIVSSERTMRLINARVPIGYRSSTPGCSACGSRWAKSAISFSSLASADSSALTDRIAQREYRQYLNRGTLGHRGSPAVDKRTQSMPSRYSIAMRDPSSGTGNSIDRSNGE